LVLAQSTSGFVLSEAKFCAFLGNFLLSFGTLLSWIDLYNPYWCGLKSLWRFKACPFDLVFRSC
jgi:hypothetical protein